MTYDEWVAYHTTIHRAAAPEFTEDMYDRDKKIWDVAFEEGVKEGRLQKIDDSIQEPLDYLGEYDD